MDVIIFHPFFKLLNNVENNNFLENETFFGGGGCVTNWLVIEVLYIGSISAIVFCPTDEL